MATLEISVYCSPNRSVTVDTVENANTTAGMGVLRLTGAGEVFDYVVYDLATTITSLENVLEETPSDYIVVFAAQGSTAGVGWTDALVEQFELFGFINIPGLQAGTVTNWAGIGKKEGTILGESINPTNAAPLTYSVDKPIQKRTENWLSKDGRDVDKMRTMTGDLLLGETPGADNPYEATGGLVSIEYPAGSEKYYDEAPDRKHNANETVDKNFKIRNVAPAEKGSDVVNLQQLVDHIVDDSDTLTSTGGAGTPSSRTPSQNKTWSQRRINEILQKMMDALLDYVDTRTVANVGGGSSGGSGIAEGSGYGDESGCDGGVIFTGSSGTDAGGTSGGTAVVEKTIFISDFELSLNAETNGTEVPVDLFGVIKPNITAAEKNKKVIILDVRPKKISPIWWAKWVWSCASGAVTDSVVLSLWNSNVLTQTYYSPYPQTGAGTNWVIYPGNNTVWWPSGPSTTIPRPTDYASLQDLEGNTITNTATIVSGGYDTAKGWQDIWKSFVDAVAPLGLKGQSWEEFKATYKTSDPLNAATDNDPTKWDNVRLYNDIRNYHTIDLAYWGDVTVDGAGNATSIAPKTGFLHAVGDTGHSDYTLDVVVTFNSGEVQSITPTMLSEYFPTEEQTDDLGTVNWTWRPGDTTKWTHSPDNVDGAATKSGSTYIHDGIAKFSSQVDWTGYSGYSKPFSLQTTPMSVLFAISPHVNSDGTVTPVGDLFSGQNVMEKILDPDSHGDLTIFIPEQFILN